MQRPDIYSYTDYRPYLNDLYAYLKASKKRFSLRSLQVPRDDGSGNYSPQFLNLVIKGDKPMPQAMIANLAKAMELNEREAQFLERLVEYTLAPTPQAKAVAFDRLAWRSEFRERQGIGSRKRLSFITHGHIGDVYLMTALPGFKANPDWIAARLLAPVNTADINEALTVLQELGLIEINQAGQVKRLTSQQPVPATGEEILFRLYHHQQCDKAKVALDKLPTYARAFHTWGISRFTPQAFAAFIAEFEQRISATLAELVNKYESQDKQDGDIVAQVNLQIFPVNHDGSEQGETT